LIVYYSITSFSPGEDSDYLFDGMKILPGLIFNYAYQTSAPLHQMAKRKLTAWNKHVKATRKKHPKKKFGEVLAEAKKTYKK